MDPWVFEFESAYSTCEVAHLFCAYKIFASTVEIVVNIELAGEQCGLVDSSLFLDHIFVISFLY